MFELLNILSASAKMLSYRTDNPELQAVLRDAGIPYSSHNAPWFEVDFQVAAHSVHVHGYIKVKGFTHP